MIRNIIVSLVLTLLSISAALKCFNWKLRIHYLRKNGRVSMKGGALLKLITKDRSVVMGFSTVEVISHHESNLMGC